jgi:hypothetical protein
VGKPFLMNRVERTSMLPLRPAGEKEDVLYEFLYSFDREPRGARPPSAGQAPEVSIASSLLASESESVL